MENNCSRCVFFNELDAGWERAFKNHPRSDFIRLLDRGVSPIEILYGHLKVQLYEAQSSDTYFAKDNPDFKDGFIEALLDVYANTYNLAYLEAQREKEGA